MGASLRKESYSMALAKAASKLVPKGVEFEIADLSEIPILNTDKANPLPKPVALLKKQIASADAILFSTPEYNYSVPGFLKNAIDWASLAPNNAFDDKPAAIMSSSDGPWGGSRAAYHLRQVLVSVNTHTIKLQAMVAKTPEKIKNGILVDEETKKQIKNVLEQLVDWAERINR